MEALVFTVFSSLQLQLLHQGANRTASDAASCPRGATDAGIQLALALRNLRLGWGFTPAWAELRA